MISTVQQGEMTGETEFDKILSSINGAIDGYLSTRPNVQAIPAAPVAPATAQTDWIMLLLVAAALYVMLK